MATGGIYALKTIDKSVARTQCSRNRNNKGPSSSASSYDNTRPRFHDRQGLPIYYDRDQFQGYSYDRGYWSSPPGLGPGQQPMREYAAPRGGAGLEYVDAYTLGRGCQGPGRGAAARDPGGSDEVVYNDLPENHYVQGPIPGRHRGVGKAGRV
ncbi:hypothetical protein DL98DRAFT_508228 [Cadophora sp. DSE1049]|nr:hypothetical protein DL98DRAFT_508228 [Cadophora sp. DSE1049]